MRAALTSGLWADSTEDGLIDLASQLNYLVPPKGIVSDIHHWDENSAQLKGYDIHLSHSFGCAAVLKMLSYFPDEKIKLWVLIDPVRYFWAQGFTIPPQVERAICLRRVRPWIPAPSSLITNPSDVYQNIDGIDSSHKDMPRNPIVIKTVLDAISALK